MEQVATTDAPTAKPKKRLGRLRRIWKWTWRTSVLLLFALYFSRNVLLGPWALNIAEQKVAEILGTEVELDGISGNWWNTLRLETARTKEPAASGSLRAFDIGGIQLSYSIPQLVRGDLAGLELLHCERVDLQLSSAPPADAPQEEEASEPFEFPQELPGVQVDRLSVAYDDGQAEATFQDGSLRVEESAIELRLPVFDFARGEQVAPSLSVQAQAVYEAGRISVSSLVLNDRERVRELWFDFRERQSGRLAYRVDFDLLEGAVRSTGQLADGVVTAEFNTTQLQAEQLEPWLDLGLRGSLAVQGEVSWPMADAMAATADLQFSANQNAWRQLELAAIEGQVTLADGWLRSPSLQVRGDGLLLDAKAIELPLFDWQSRAERTGRFEFSVDDLPAWLARTGVELPPTTQELLALQVHGQIQSQVEQVQVQVSKFELATSLGPVRAQAMVSLPDYAFGPDSQLDLQLESDRILIDELIATLGQYAELPEQVRELSGHASVRASLSGTAAQPEATLSLDVLDLPLEKLAQQLPESQARAQINLALSNGVVRLEPCLIDSPFIEASLQSQMPLNIDLSAIARGQLPSLAGQVESTLDLRTDLPELARGAARLSLDTQLVLTEQGAWESASAAWEVSANDMLLDLPGQEGEAPQTIRLADPNLSGVASFTPGDDWLEQLQCDLLVEFIQFANFPEHSVALEFGYQDGLARIADLDVSGGIVSIDCQGQFPWRPSAGSLIQDGPLDFAGTVAEFDLQKVGQQLAQMGVELPVHWTGSATANWKLSNNWRDPRLEVNLAGRDLRALDVGDAAAGQEDTWIIEAFDGDFSLLAEKNVVTLQRCELDSPQFTLAAGGQWTGSTDLLALVNDGAIPDGTLDLQGDLAVPELLWLQQLPGIRRISGRGEAHFAVAGPLSKPAVQASWAMHEGALRLDNPTIAAFERLEFAGDFDGKTLRLGHCEGELGSAPFTARGEVALLTDQSPQVDVTLSGTDLLLYRREGVKLRSDTDLRLHGPLDALKIGGELALTDGRYTKPVDFILPLLRRGQPPSTGVEGISLFSLPAPLENAEFDLAVKPGNGFRIKTNVANGMLRPDVRLLGTGEIPYLIGDIYLDRIILNLPAHRITIEQGVVRFLEKNPFIPNLDIHASFRRYGYDVTIQVTGDILEPIVTLSSIPPLESDDLLLLATTGQPPQESANAREALGTIAVYLAQDWLRRFFGDLSTEEEENLFDRLEIEFGRDATHQGAETIEGRFLLKRDNIFDDDALFLTGERDAYSDFNLGVRIRFLFP